MPPKISTSKQAKKFQGQDQPDPKSYETTFGQEAMS
jgi:hypothetical protein